VTETHISILTVQKLFQFLASGLVYKPKEAAKETNRAARGVAMVMAIILNGGRLNGSTPGKQESAPGSELECVKSAPRATISIWMG
jgi:hypothetical protein